MDIKSHSPFKLEIYCDESAPDKNYKTFSMVYSLNPYAITDLSNLINQFISNNKIKEIKWKDVFSAQRAEVIISLLEEIKPYVDVNKVCILSGCISLGNIRKNEHKSSNNNAINLLAYNMLKYVVKQTKLNDVLFKIVVDKDGPLYIDRIKSSLNNHLQGPNLSYYPILYTREELIAIDLKEAAAYGDMYEENTKPRFSLEDIYEKDSAAFPIIQLADLFAGMHGFSYNSTTSASKSVEAKQTILNYITNTYQNVTNNHGLKSPPNSNPNFWLFK